MDDLQALWDKAVKRTELIRLRLQDLSTFDATAVPYVFLAESALHPGDTVMRKGHVLIERPSLILPKLSPQFEGFDFEQALHANADFLTTFLLLRGIQFPSLRYRHELSSMDVREQSLRKAITQVDEQLTMAEDIKTGLVVGPEDAWQCSVLLLVGALVIRSAGGDLRRLLEDWSKRQRGPSGQP